ncbi:SPOR domain-containing protein [Marinobacter sp. F3R08]|uniref:SPOR domain-containing protein n=1 Tax=Marinobacter sp. F3R08 TaxID=2841559 RepID=UPI001C08F6A2|nr:SPOR domain-containing protein [Marinobacter sp. F3R08]MBU2955690.1 SPOR domain-containing protein [Marinobacter sp. F3R08]
MDGLKQRIIGALVLVSLAVIFVPMLFDEPHSERTSTNIKIPEEPPFPEVEAPESEMTPAPSYGLESSDTTVAEPAVGENDDSPAYRMLEESPADVAANPVPEPSDTAESVEEASQEPVEDSVAVPVETDAQAEENSTVEAAEFERSLEGAWVVQLGSFGNADNARRLRDQVREKGYGSHLQEVVRGDATLTRVFSGPFASESEAESAKRALDDAFSLNSLVTSGEK